MKGEREKRVERMRPKNKKPRHDDKEVQIFKWSDSYTMIIDCGIQCNHSGRHVGDPTSGGLLLRWRHDM